MDLILDVFDKTVSFVLFLFGIKIEMELMVVWLKLVGKGGKKMKI